MRAQKRPARSGLNVPWLIVSGFLISPKDHDRMSSGLAMEILIWSKVGSGACVLNRLVISFIRLSIRGVAAGAPCQARENRIAAILAENGLLASMSPRSVCARFTRG